MTDKDIKKMWDIDCKAQLGDKISNEEKEFFNANYTKMQNDMKSNYEHWKYHSGLL